MRQCGGFYIKPENDAFKYAMSDIILEALENLNFDSDNFWLEYFNTDNLDVDYETFIDFHDYESAFIEICKELAANFPHAAFDGVSHYCNESAGFSVDYLVKYDGERDMLIYTLEYCDGDDFVESACPECGKSISVELWDGSLNNIIPTEVWCYACDKSFPIEEIADVTELRI